MSPPVTVSITRHVDPGHEAEMMRWMQAGTTLAEQFPGFLGVGWVRPAPESETWHMLYRFADAASLDVWESSPERLGWRDSAGELGVVDSRIERRTGIEGWFDDPTTRDVRDLRLRPTAPPRWKQGVVIWLVFFPLSLLTSWLTVHFVPGLALLPRVLGTTLVMTPLMTYIVLPRMTKALGWWLRAEPAPWRRNPSGVVGAQ